VVQSNGHYGLSCRRSAGRQSRHHAGNAILAHTLRSACVPDMLEPPGLIRGDGKRLDGMTLVGRTMACELPAQIR